MKAFIGFHPAILLAVNIVSLVLLITSVFVEPPAQYWTHVAGWIGLISAAACGDDDDRYDAYLLAFFAAIATTDSLRPDGAIGIVLTLTSFLLAVALLVKFLATALPADYRKHLKKSTTGMLLAWRNLRPLLADAMPAIIDMGYHLTMMIFALLMPFFFWLAPVIAWSEVRSERKSAAHRLKRAMAQYEANKE